MPLHGRWISSSNPCPQHKVSFSFGDAIPIRANNVMVELIAVFIIFSHPSTKPHKSLLLTILSIRRLYYCLSTRHFQGKCSLILFDMSSAPFLNLSFGYLKILTSSSSKYSMSTLGKCSIQFVSFTTSFQLCVCVCVCVCVCGFSTLFFFVTPVALGSSQTRDQTSDTAEN